MSTDPRLFEMLAEAIGRPSKAYRAAQDALSIPTQALGGYMDIMKSRQAIQEARLKPYEIWSKISESAGPDAANTIFQKAGMPIPETGVKSGSDYSPEQLMNMGKFGQERLGMMKTRQDIENTAPFTADQVRAQLVENPELADALIKGYPDGQIPSRAVQNAISTIRPNTFQGQLGLRTQTLRDSLIKEARNSLDPFFQTGEGRAQAQRLNSIGRTEPLISQMLSQPGGGDQRQMRELATRIDSVLRGSPNGQQAIEGINALVPNTARGKFANWLEWFSNDPHGTDQQTFIRRYADTLGREKNAIQGQIKQVISRTAPTLRVLQSQFPDDYNAVVNQYVNGVPEITGTSGNSTGIPGVDSDPMGLFK